MTTSPNVSSYIENGVRWYVYRTDFGTFSSTDPLKVWEFIKRVGKVR